MYIYYSVPPKYNQNSFKERSVSHYEVQIL